MVTDAFQKPQEGLAFMASDLDQHVLCIVSGDVLYRFVIPLLAVSRLACDASSAVRKSLHTQKENSFAHLSPDNT
jgi:hypothetical protein